MIPDRRPERLSIKDIDMNSTHHAAYPAVATLRLGAVLTLGQYAEARSHVFGSLESLRWFVRKHQDELVAAGALLRLTDRWMIEPEVFDAAVLEIGARAAGRAVA